MSTAQVDDIDPPAKNAENGEEEEDEAPKPAEAFMFYLQRDNMHEIIQKRWGIFFLFTSVIYSYHFMSIIVGMDKYVHYSRFTGCEGATDFKQASAVYDGAIFLVLVFHIIEWVR